MGRSQTRKFEQVLEVLDDTFIETPDGPLTRWSFSGGVFGALGSQAAYSGIREGINAVYGALVAAASRMILALGFLNFAFECAILLANPAVPVTPLTSILFWHLTASLFLPWSWRESLRPILPLLAAWLLLRLGLAVGDGGWGSLVATVIALPFLFAPALILCYARLRWHRNRFKSGFVGRRFLAMRREFLHVDDLADALVFLMKVYSDEVPLNVGSGVEVSIRELAETIAKVVGYEATLTWDSSKPDGTPRKLMDSSRLHALGWNRARGLEEGIADAYAHWLAHGGRGA